METRFRTASQAFSAARGSILVSQVDPDAMGSAVGLMRLVEALTGYRAPILYAGGIGHTQNRTIFNRFDLKACMSPIRDVEDAPGATALVDSSKSDDSRLPWVVEPTIVVDHHRGSDLEEFSGRFFWLDPAAGSACTQMVELYRLLDVDIEHQAALMLAVGIYADTGGLLSGGPRDRAAYNHLCALFSPNEITALACFPLPDTFFDNMGRMLENYKSQGSRVVSSLGEIDASCADDLSTFADMILRRPGAELVVVWGEVNGMIRASARSSDLSDPLDERLYKLFGDKSGVKVLPDGKSEGGALIQMDLGVWLIPQTKTEAHALIHKRFQHWIFEE